MSRFCTLAQIKKEVKKVLRDYLIKVQRDIPVDLAILNGCPPKEIKST